MRCVPILLLAGCAAAPPTADGFTPLFDGRSLDAWTSAPGSN